MNINVQSNEIMLLLSRMTHFKLFFCCKKISDTKMSSNITPFNTKYFHGRAFKQIIAFG